MLTCSAVLFRIILRIFLNTIAWPNTGQKLKGKKKGAFRLNAKCDGSKLLALNVKGGAGEGGAGGSGVQCSCIPFQMHSKSSSEF